MESYTSFGEMFVSRDAVMELVYSSRPYPAVKITSLSSSGGAAAACAIEEEGISVLMMRGIVEDRDAIRETNRLLLILLLSSFEGGVDVEAALVNNECMADHACA
mmetsp:Transcript_1453/g.2104  ORF Transcript_1453/g.2104 Transcript_1453/m.2104 type:complete len:105 (+) Transcript_1453:734-1048(+)